MSVASALDTANTVKNYLVLFLAVVMLGPRYYYMQQSANLPVYDAPEPYHRLQNLWTPEEMTALRKLVSSQESFHTASEDITSHTMEVEYPTNPDGSCPHHFLVPKGMNSTSCVLPGRLDIISHYMKTGGRYGAKETVDTMANNLQSFQRYLFGEQVAGPEFKALFESDEYSAAESEICGADHPVKERVQVNLIIMLPGQDLPMHYDLPWYRNGASRHTLPQWLLMAMSGSRLWHDQLLPQVQGVAYLHLNQSLEGGDFFLYPEGPGARKEVVVLPADANTGVVLDGIRVIHGVQRFAPGGGKTGRPRSVAPAVGKYPASMRKLAHSEDDDRWEVRSQDGRLLGVYSSRDLRISLVWRSICFRDEEDRAGWDPKVPKFDVEDILQALEDDLRERGALAHGEPRPDPINFALMMLDEYVRYPVDNFGSAYFPLNYCLLPELLPAGAASDVVKDAFSWLCT